MIVFLVTVLFLVWLPCVVTAGESAGAAFGRPATVEPESSFPGSVGQRNTLAALPAGYEAEPRGQVVRAQLPAFRLADSFEKFVSGDDSKTYGGNRGAYGGEPAIYVDSQTVLRGGWWTTDVQGSPVMIGEYQDLEASPFWELDHLGTDGARSMDVSFVGTDNETTQAGWDYAGLGLRADVEYDRFIHALSPDRLANFPQPVADPANPGSYLPVSGELIAEDLNVGEDYAIRVQQLKANFQGDLTDKLRWRLNVWGLRKEGERQVTALADCFDHQQIAGETRQCHVLSRRQRIDWLTTELEPGLEGKWGAVTVSYSRPMRSFNQNDQPLTRLYNSYPPIHNGESMPPQLGSEAFPDGAFYPYAIVPENLTQIDKLKIGIDITEKTRLYGLLYYGSTENRHRNFERDFGGFDVRLTDRPLENLKWTSYAKLNYETNQLPSVLISGEQLTFDRYDETEIECTWSDSRQYGGCGCAPVVVPCVVGEDGVPDFFASDALVPLIDYTRTTAGVNGRWTPFRGERTGRRGLALYGRYEYRLLHRENAVFEGTLAPAVVADFEQPDTGSHIVHVGISKNWSRAYETFVRGTTRYDSQPLYGVRGSNGTTNSSLPIHTDLVELGGTWSPAAYFFANVTFGLQNRFQHSAVADFDEDSYPLTVSAWYAPTCAMSFSAGYAYLTNWIQQAITLGDDFDNGAPYAPVTRNWDYGGRSEVWSLGSTYAWTRRLTLRGNLQYVQGRNEIASTVFDEPYVWPEIAAVARDEMDAIRLSTGFDYCLPPSATSYFRYSYLDYDDNVQPARDGAAHLFLAGLSGRY